MRRARGVEARGYRGSLLWVDPVVDLELAEVLAAAVANLLDVSFTFA